MTPLLPGRGGLTAYIRPDALWHFTCEHGYMGLGEAGLLRLNPHALIPSLGNVSWLTSDPDPSRDDVGLTSSFLSCDRMEYRYRLDNTAGCVPWVALRNRCPSGLLRDLESFGSPETWWLTFQRRRVVLDPQYLPAREEPQAADSPGPKTGGTHRTETETSDA